MDHHRIQTAEITESIKLAFDSFKHLSTLNAGSIVLIGTFLKDIFPSENGALAVGLGIKALIAISFAGFGSSLALAVWTTHRYTRLLDRFVRSTLDLDRAEKANLESPVRVMALWFFWIGLFCFGLAVLITL
jgi:hypothetical protein